MEYINSSTFFVYLKKKKKLSKLFFIFFFFHKIHRFLNDFKGCGNLVWILNIPGDNKNNVTMGLLQTLKDFWFTWVIDETADSVEIKAFSMIIFQFLTLKNISSKNKAFLITQ